MVDYSLILDAGVGVGVFLVGVAFMIGMLALAKTMGRLNQTLDEVDRQLSTMGTPVGQTLGHLEGIAG
ncbi:MAG TPA: hypothetical protein VMH02_00180, partial [Verrucomicrobiae bacterium]|nr:hypothetical protein [Verrucomicrobiae bacterium]